MTLRQLSSSALGRTAFLRLSAPALWTSFTRSATTASTSVCRDRSPGTGHRGVTKGPPPGTPGCKTAAAALAGNRTRASRVAGENSTTEPPMPDVGCPTALPHGPKPRGLRPAGTGTAGWETPSEREPQQTALMPRIQTWQHLFLLPQTSPPGEGQLSLAFRVNTLMTRLSKACSLLGGAKEPAPGHRTTQPHFGFTLEAQL